MRNYAVLAFLLLAGLAVGITPVAAQTPTVTGTDYGNQTMPFPAIWATNDGGSIGVGQTLYFAATGDSSARTSEDQQDAKAPFAYTLTNFYVVSGVANCGGLGTGQSIAFAVRINHVDTALTGTCANGAAADSFTLDTDTVAVAQGDIVTVRATMTGGLVGSSMTVGVTATGYTTFAFIPQPECPTPTDPDSLKVRCLTFNGLGFDGFLFVLLFAGIFLWGGYTRQLLVSLSGLLGIVVTYTDGVPFANTYPLLLALLAAAVLAIRQSWQAMGKERKQAEETV